MQTKQVRVGIGVLIATLIGFSVVPVFAQTDDYGTTAGTYCPQLFQTVVRGLSGNQVLELQKFLSDYYDIPPATIQTGYFGRITQGYVIQFQKEQGLPSYGIAGSMTRAAIAKVCGDVASNPISPTYPTISYGQSSIVLGTISPVIEQDSVTKISWSSKNAPKESYVALSVIDATSEKNIGSIEGTINPQSGNYDPHPVSGTIDWRGSINDIDVGFNIGDVQRFSSCTGNWPNTVCSPQYSGKYKIRAELRPANYCVRGQSGETQANCSSSLYATTDSNVFTVASITTAASATIDQRVTVQELNVQPGCYTFARQPCGSITFSGTATNVNSLYVALFKEDYRGGIDYDTLLNATKTLDSPPAQMNTVSVSAGTWSTTFRNTVGTYYVLGFQTNSKKLLLQEKVVVY